MTGLAELRKRLGPFQLARTLERKLERIYRLANRRPSPKQVQQTASRQRGPWKRDSPRELEIKKKFSTFP